VNLVKDVFYLHNMPDSLS